MLRMQITDSVNGARIFCNLNSVIGSTSGTVTFCQKRFIDLLDVTLDFRTQTLHM